jgi:hypothetical protein
LPSRAGTAPTRGAASSACILSVDEAMAAAIARRRRTCRVGYGESLVPWCSTGRDAAIRKILQPGDSGARQSACFEGRRGSSDRPSAYPKLKLKILNRPEHKLSLKPTDSSKSETHHYYYVNKKQCEFSILPEVVTPIFKKTHCV